MVVSAKTCSDLPDMTHGTYRTDAKVPYHIGDVAIMTCDKDYKPAGSVEIVCTLSEEGEPEWMTPSDCVG